MDITEGKISSFTISVVIPAYNCADCIDRSIDSVLGQSLQPQEIIIVDDGSTDTTASTVKKYSDKIRYIHQQNAGVSAARNAGIKVATSEWIAFLDADDEWQTDKLQRQIELLKRNPNLVWVSANYTRCLCNEKRSGPMAQINIANKLLSGKDYHSEFFEAFAANSAGWTGTMIIKRSVLLDTGLFAMDMAVAEDLDMWFRIAYDHPQIGYIAEPLATYHLSISQSLSKTIHNMDIQAEMIKRHLVIAEQKQRLDALKICLGPKVTIWIRSLLFHNQPEQVKRFLDDFKDMLNPCYVLLIRILMLSPKATAWCCHIISKIVRTLKIRKQITNPPPKMRD